jgi:hypothetical protein
MKAASRPSYNLWKSHRDYDIPTVSATGYVSCRSPSIRTIATARGLKRMSQAHNVTHFPGHSRGHPPREASLSVCRLPAGWL